MKVFEKNIRPEVRNTIPSVLIDYLWDMIGENGEAGEIILIPVQLGFGEVQDIFWETTDSIIVRRVFGFKAVSAHLKIIRCDDQYEMAFAS